MTDPIFLIGRNDSSRQQPRCCCMQFVYLWFCAGLSQSLAAYLVLESEITIAL